MKRDDGFKIFTLIELLVVVAIVAILFALLLPALRSVKDRGTGIACLGNLRQVGMATFDYCCNNASWLPFAYDQNPLPSGCAYSFSGYGHPSVGQWGILLAPFFNLQPLNYYQLKTCKIPCVFTCQALGLSGASNNPVYYAPPITAAQGVILQASPAFQWGRLDNVARPSSKCWTGDSACNATQPSFHPWFVGVDGYVSNLQFRHNGGKGTNLLFFDGHSRLAAWSECISPGAPGAISIKSHGIFDVYDKY